MKKIDILSDIEILKGVAAKKKEVLNKFNIYTLADLLYYFPRRYLDRTITSLAELTPDTDVTLIVTVVDTYLAHGKKSRLIVGVKTESKQRISLVFFRGIQYFQNTFKEGMTIIVTGKLEYFRGLQIVHPDFEVLSSPKDLEEGELLHTGRIIPLYSSNEALKTQGMDSRGFRRLIKQILSFVDSGYLHISENLPLQSVQKRNLVNKIYAFKEIHFPSDELELNKARQRFIYEELYYFILLIDYKKKLREKVPRKLWALKESNTADRILRNLPFKLTPDQMDAIQKMKELNQKEIPMSVLLQGDVGSGKTLTALAIALHYTDNDIQVCLLAPTEILARQHYITITSLLSYSPFNAVELFVGKEKDKTKREKLDRLKKGEILFAIGTHTLIQNDVEFKDLGLVIIDEQHKFGVEQRDSIISKGKNPDILAMTATPIPRTLCLTAYGELSLISIKNKPKGRKPIVTKWFIDEKRKAIYNSVRKYIAQGRQCYIIYPLVEESEKVDLQSCIDSYESLRTVDFPEFKVGLLHGKMKTQEKDYVMSEFKRNAIQILVATTVVEVGIDVPNATVLIIEHADRFGISQLHQLRGRVGRGEHESFCILMTQDRVTDEAKIRLEAMVETNDGFELSEVDLKLRGPGELLGLRQSGLPDFKLADIQRDEQVIEMAKQDVMEFGEIGPIEIYELRKRFPEGNNLFPN